MNSAREGSGVAPTGSAATPGSMWRQWTAWAPALGIAVLVVTWGRAVAPELLLAAAVVLAGVVLSAVHHAEVVAHRVGEPFGSLVLAVSVTVIEVALIVTLMVAGGEGSAALARDTVFAAAMITMNGILGLSLLVGAGAMARRCSMLRAAVPHWRRSRLWQF